MKSNTWMNSITTSTLFAVLLLPLTGIAGSPIAQTLPKPVCERSHEYAVKLLNVSNLSIVNDQAYELNRAFYSKKPWFIPRSEIENLNREGIYSEKPIDKKNNYNRLIPRFMMGEENAKGGLKTGLCWWHSRYQRAAAYLVEFLPNAPKPSSMTAKRWMQRLTFFQPVVISGYESLADFHKDFPDELHDVLTQWEIRASVTSPKEVIGHWLTEIASSSKQRQEIITDSFRNLLDDLDAAPRPVFFMLGMGKTSIHAVLALGYRLTATGEILLKVVDSNFPTNSDEISIFKDGKISTEFSGYDVTLTHTQFDTDFTKIQNGLKRVCGQDYKIPLK